MTPRRPGSGGDRTLGPDRPGQAGPGRAGRASPATEAAGGVSRSLAKLRDLQGSFAHASARPIVPTPIARRATRLVAELGKTAMPLLGRKLRAGDEREASWAYFLLAGAGVSLAEQTARAVALDEGTSDERRALALALLGELGAEVPDGVRLRDPATLRRDSVRELLEVLDEPAAVARAADLIRQQVPADELVGFMTDVAEVAADEARPLLAELLLRDDLEAGAATSLRRLLDDLGGAPPCRAPRAVARVRTWLGAHPDGRTVVAAMAPGRRARPRRIRAAVLEIEAGRLTAGARHEPELVPGRGPAALLDDLRSQGFGLSPFSRPAAASLVVQAARATRRANARLPAAFYLGRDLLGLYDEHAVDVCPPATGPGAPRPGGPGRGDRPRRGPRRVAPAARDDELERALRLAEEGDRPGARRLLERRVEACPEDAEARSRLGALLLDLELGDEALGHLRAAAHLQPRDPARHWNLAQGARRAGRLGGCYLALADYLRLRDRSAGAGARAREARGYLRLFERFARREHPESPVENVARAEELFERACVHLGEGRTDEAIGGFEAVLKLVPSHYPSWGNLGAAHMTMRHDAQAEHCLRRALEYRPDYEVARRNLMALQA